MTVESSGPAGTELNQEFLNTIEEAGLGDIAVEVGLVTGQPAGSAELPQDLAQPQQMAAHHQVTMHNDAPAGAIMHAQHVDPAAASAVASAPPTLVPYASSGIAIPPELAGTLCAAGEPAAKKKRLQRAGGGKAGDKGLRHFSMKVCEKVEQKGRTTYNEVADELVAEFATEMDSAVDQAYDEKNIRRRVYDALNVLMAMEIITKEKKNIMWRGLPTNTQQEGSRMKMELSSRKERLDRKRLHLQELLTHFISTKNLVKRNRCSPPAAEGDAADRIAMPFIIVNSRKEAVIDCEMAEDKQNIFFNFSTPFELHDEYEILKRMRMQYCSDLGDVATMVPERLVEFTTEWQRQQLQLLAQQQQQQKLMQLSAMQNGGAAAVM